VPGARARAPWRREMCSTLSSGRLIFANTCTCEIHSGARGSAHSTAGASSCCSTDVLPLWALVSWYLCSADMQIAVQDLLKRLLQKNPNKRLAFDAFFAHPFLSGEPLRTPAMQDQAPNVIVEEPSSHFGTIEDDYVILSIPAPPAGALKGAAGRAGTRRRGQAVQASISGQATASERSTSHGVLGVAMMFVVPWA
jgi:hypothetical protein